MTRRRVYGRTQYDSLKIPVFASAFARVPVCGRRVALSIPCDLSIMEATEESSTAAEPPAAAPEKPDQAESKKTHPLHTGWAFYSEFPEL